MKDSCRPPYIYKQDLELNNLQVLIFYLKPTNQPIYLSIYLFVPSIWF